MRDFQDQLRLQTGSIGAHGYGVTRIPLAAPPTGASSNLGHGVAKEPIGSFTGITPQHAIHHTLPTAALGRDITADLAAVRALQEQDRVLAQTYSRY